MKKLKKSQIFLITTFGLAALFLTFVLMVGLTSDSFGFGAGRESGPRNNVNTQDIDPEEAEVTALEVKWLNGPVTVGVSPDDRIHVTERTEEKLDEGRQMDVSVRSGTLAVRWDNQWFRRWINIDFGWFGVQDKELEVLLPEGLAGRLLELDVENTSGQLQVAGLQGEKLSVSTVSGALSLTDCLAAEELSASSVSGSVSLEGAASGEAMHISTVSGGVVAAGASTRELDISTVSGRCSYKGTAEELHFSTVSGDMAAALANCPEEADMESVSGGLVLGLPENAGFTVEYDSLSGEFRSDFPVETGGGKAQYGTGGAEISMSTTSGDMTVERSR